jgi:NADH:ubiquinone oxidoreductase subunit 2 (subunit N)
MDTIQGWGLSHPTLFSLGGFSLGGDHGALYQSSLFENDFAAVLPELFLISTSLLLLLFGAIFSTSAQSGFPVLLRNVAALVELVLVYTLLLLLFNPIEGGIFLYSTFLVDFGTFFFKLLVVIGTLFSIQISTRSLESEGISSFEFTLLLALSTGGMFFLISAADLLSMYLAIEFQALCFYVVAAFKRDSEFSTEAGVKYFLLGAFSSGLLLFGCSLLYGFTGVIGLADMAELFSCGAGRSLELSCEATPWLPLAEKTGVYGTPLGVGCEVGMIFLLVGFLFKLTAVPFHMWAPDVYEGAPLAVTGFFSITPKAALLAVFTRLLYESFYDFMLDSQTLLLFCAIGSMIGGSIAGLAQLRIKRLLAYSSIGHVGYLLLALSCGTLEGLQALVIYLVIYMIMTVNLFSVLLAPLRRSHFDTLDRIKYTSDLAMVGRTNPLLGATLAVGLFSIAGIPPLAGFYSKAFLFWAALSSSQIVGAFVGIGSSVVSCFYYIRVVNIMYFQAPKTPLTFSRLSVENSYIAGITFLFLLFFMVYPSPLYSVSHRIGLAFSL